jgi:hypothetical protein
VVEELASLKILHGTTTAENLFLSVFETMKEFELQQIKLKAVTTDGVPSMIGKKTGWMGRIRQERDKFLNFTLNIAASSPNSHSAERFFKSEHETNIVMWILNFIPFQGLHRRQLQFLWSDISAETGDVLYHTEV